jgi:hypothetical protein
VPSGPRPDGADELIDRIEIQTETPEGEVFFATTIDAELIPWSPNRAAPLPRDALSRDRRAGVRRAHARSRDE